MTPAYTPPDWEEDDTWTRGELLLVLLIPLGVALLVPVVWFLERVY